MSNRILEDYRNFALNTDRIRQRYIAAGVDVPATATIDELTTIYLEDFANKLSTNPAGKKWIPDPLWQFGGVMFDKIYNNHPLKSQFQFSAAYLLSADFDTLDLRAGLPTAQEITFVTSDGATYSNTTGAGLVHEWNTAFDVWDSNQNRVRYAFVFSNSEIPGLNAPNFNRQCIWVIYNAGANIGAAANANSTASLFRGCRKLQCIETGGNVTSIGSTGNSLSSFADCTALNKGYFPSVDNWTGSGFAGTGATFANTLLYDFTFSSSAIIMPHMLMGLIVEKFDFSNYAFQGGNFVAASITTTGIKKIINFPYMASNTGHLFSGVNTLEELHYSPTAAANFFAPIVSISNIANQINAIRLTKLTLPNISSIELRFPFNNGGSVLEELAINNNTSSFTISTGAVVIKRLIINSTILTALNGTNQITGLTDIKVPLGFNLALSIGNVSNDLNKQSIIDLFNALADRTGQTANTVVIGARNLSKLTPQEITIATNKNWTVS